jgi:hypothetical protein
MVRLVALMSWEVCEYAHHAFTSHTPAHFYLAIDLSDVTADPARPWMLRRSDGLHRRAKDLNECQLIAAVVELRGPEGILTA